MAREGDEEEAKPIPRGWIIGGALAAIAALAVVAWGAARVWRSSNLFDRQYHFPPVENVPIRLGGEKSGGHQARVQFGAGRRRRAAVSEAKDV